MLHIDRHFIDAGEILTLDDRGHIHITEMGHLLPDSLIQLMFRTQHQDFRLNTQSLQLLHTGLRGFGLQLSCRCQIGHIGKMHIQRPCRPQFPT